jgi:hypothetical protein
MSKQYLRELVDFAQREIPLLNYDFQNASTHMTLQAATQRLFNVTTYMLHHLIHAAYEEGGTPAAAPAPAPAPVAPPVRVAPPAPVAPSPAGFPRLPSPSPISQPAANATAVEGYPEATVQPGVTNVIITAQGTRVVAPSGAASVVPPGEHVSLEASLGIPPQPLDEPGVATVVLPPGGGMSPDVLAALSGRTGQ